MVTSAGRGHFEGRGTGGVSDLSVIYSGQDFSHRGDKDRYVLPANFRKTVALSSTGNTLLVSKHARRDCLIGFGESRRAGLQAQIDREYELALAAGKPFDRDLAYFQAFEATPITFDNSGRFVIPKHLRDLVGIASGIYFHGSGPFFTLWAPAVLEAQAGPEWASARAACAHFATKAGR